MSWPRRSLLHLKESRWFTTWKDRLSRGPVKHSKIPRFPGFCRRHQPTPSSSYVNWGIGMLDSFRPSAGLLFGVHVPCLSLQGTSPSALSLATCPCARLPLDCARFWGPVCGSQQASNSCKSDLDIFRVGPQQILSAFSPVNVPYLSDSKGDSASGRRLSSRIPYHLAPRIFAWQQRAPSVGLQRDFRLPPHGRHLLPLCILAWADHAASAGRVPYRGELPMAADPFKRIGKSPRPEPFLRLGSIADRALLLRKRGGEARRFADLLHSKTSNMLKENLTGNWLARSIT
jgi:hypothetical protein